MYIQTDINIVDERFVQELQEVIEGSRSVKKMSMIFELHNALYIEHQNVDDNNKLALHFLDNNRDIVSRIVQTIEQFIEKRPICDLLKLNINENMSDNAPEYGSNIHRFYKNLNGFTILFNENHRTLIQVIEQNCSKVNGAAIAQCQEHYGAVLHAIEQNSTFEYYSIILASARESYQYLREAIREETNARIQQGVETDDPMWNISSTVIDAIQEETNARIQQRVQTDSPMWNISSTAIEFTSWIIVTAAITIFAALFITGGDKVIMTLVGGFIFFSIFILRM